MKEPLSHTTATGLKDFDDCAYQPEILYGKKNGIRFHKEYGCRDRIIYCSVLLLLFLGQYNIVNQYRSGFCALGVYALHTVVAYLAGFKITHAAFAAAGADFAFFQNAVFHVH